MRPLRIVGALVGLAAIGLLGFWAGGAALEPPDDPLESAPSEVVYTVEEETVSRGFSFVAVGEWSTSPAGRNADAGTVTSVDVDPGQQVSSGDVLYTLDLRPVVAAEGEVPMFRTLELRTEGQDVRQLQELLSALGFYEGEIDGVFGVSTREAVEDWQESLGLDDDGMVEPGDAVFIAGLPARVVVSDEVSTGVQLSGGEVVVSVLPESPDFHIPLSQDQASLVPLSAAVEVEYPEGVWHGRIDRVVEGQQNQLNLILTGPNGGPLCGENCAEWVDLTAPTDFPANIIVVPETTGVGVPVAGIVSDPGNDTFVTTPDGGMIPVEIVASADGLAIVEGLESGTQIVLPGEDE